MRKVGSVSRRVETVWYSQKLHDSPEDGSEDCYEESSQNLLRSLCKAELAASALQFDSEGDFMSRLADEDEESK